VHRQQPAVLLDDVRAWFEGVAADQCRVAIVVREIEIAIECNRMRDRQVVWLIAGSGECAVADESSDDGEDSGDEDSPRAPRSRWPER
jgi:hypothetical protein